MVKPEWHELSAAQQQALAPLASSWPDLDAPRKRKWLALSQNFSAMPVAEQARIHSRMKEWASLSPSERTLARLNFAGVRELPANERLEKWQAYQSLPPEQRQHLAATAPPKPVGAATALKPVASQKLASTPVASTQTVPKLDTSPLARQTVAKPLPKIAAAPHQIDSHTLLPHQIPVEELFKQP